MNLTLRQKQELVKAACVMDTKGFISFHISKKTFNKFGMNNVARLYACLSEFHRGCCSEDEARMAMLFEIEAYTT